MKLLEAIKSRGIDPRSGFMLEMSNENESVYVGCLKHDIFANVMEYHADIKQGDTEYRLRGFITFHSDGDIWTSVQTYFIFQHGVSVASHYLGEWGGCVTQESFLANIIHDYSAPQFSVTLEQYPELGILEEVHHA